MPREQGVVVGDIYLANPQILIHNYGFTPKFHLNLPGKRYGPQDGWLIEGGLVRQIGRSFPCNVRLSREKEGPKTLFDYIQRATHMDPHRVLSELGTKYHIGVFKGFTKKVSLSFESVSEKNFEVTPVSLLIFPSDRDYQSC